MAKPSVNSPAEEELDSRTTTFLDMLAKTLGLIQAEENLGLARVKCEDAFSEAARSGFTAEVNALRHAIGRFNSKGGRKIFVSTTVRVICSKFHDKESRERAAKEIGSEFVRGISKELKRAIMREIRAMS